VLEVLRRVGEVHEIDGVGAIDAVRARVHAALRL
jgi:hypothetical protein